MITVYVDVLFTVNFIINILIVEATGLIIREDTKWQRSLLSAFLGALYATGVFFTDVEFYQSFIMKLLISAVMVFFAFKVRSKRHFFKVLASFYIVSFIFGGGVVALLSLTDIGYKTGAVYSNGTIYLNLPWKTLFMSIAITYFFIAMFSRVRKKRIEKAAVLRSLTIYIKGKRIDTKAIIDTGNSLSDPISGMPVIVCEYEEIKGILPEGEDTVLEKMIKAGIKVRLIPFSTVGKESGVMVGFLPDRTEVDCCETKKCIVGISETKLSGEEDYHALLNPMLILRKAM